MYLLVTAMIVGVVEFLRRLQLKDYFAAITILAAAVVGGICGYFHTEGLPDAATGVVVGLAASGLVKVAQAVGLARVVK